MLWIELSAQITNRRCPVRLHCLNGLSLYFRSLVLIIITIFQRRSISMTPSYYNFLDSSKISGTVNLPNHLFLIIIWVRCFNAHMQTFCIFFCLCENSILLHHFIVFNAKDWREIDFIFSLLDFPLTTGRRRNWRCLQLLWHFLSDCLHSFNRLLAWLD